jgi:hypothetical protein
VNVWLRNIAGAGRERRAASTVSSFTGLEQSDMPYEFTMFGDVLARGGLVPPTERANFRVVFHVDCGKHEN